MIKKDGRVYVTVQLDRTRSGDLRITLPGYSNGIVTHTDTKDPTSWSNRLHGALAWLLDKSEEAPPNIG